MAEKGNGLLPLFWAENLHHGPEMIDHDAPLFRTGVIADKGIDDLLVRFVFGEFPDNLFEPVHARTVELVAPGFVKPGFKIEESDFLLIVQFELSGQEINPPFRTERGGMGRPVSQEADNEKQVEGH